MQEETFLGESSTISFLMIFKNTSSKDVSFRLQSLISKEKKIKRFIKDY